jgi:dihydrofolate reductase
MGKSVTLIAAMGRNRAIGLDGRMPWHLPAELKHFKQVTMGKTIVMGRKTWQAIGRPLPGRQNVVISRNPAFLAKGVDLVGSLAEAIELSESDEVMIIGGGQLYEQALPLAQRMVLTLIDIEPQADTWFPDWDENEWMQIAKTHFAADDNNDLSYRIVELKRKPDQGRA